MFFTESDMKKMHRIFMIFRTIAPTIPVQVVQTLVLVAMNEGKTLGELVKLAGAHPRRRSAPCCAGRRQTWSPANVAQDPCWPCSPCLASDPL